MRAAFTALLLAALAAAPPISAQVPGNPPQPHPRTITGVVVDATTGVALPGVVVTLEDAERTYITDANGRFAFKGVRDQDGPLTARLIGYASSGLNLNAASTPQPLTIALRADPVLLRSIEVLAPQLRMPIYLEGMYSSRHFGLKDFQGLRGDWTVSDFLRSRGYLSAGPLDALAPGPRRISASQQWLTGYGASQPWASQGYLPMTALGEGYWASVRFDVPRPTVYRNGRPAFMGLETTRVGEVYAIEVYRQGRAVFVFTKAWVIDHAAELAGLPLFESPFEPQRPGGQIPPG